MARDCRNVYDDEQRAAAYAELDFGCGTGRSTRFLRDLGFDAVGVDISRPMLDEEIWSQTNGQIDAFVRCVGTAASLSGVATVLKRHRPSIEIIAVEHAESSVLLGGQAGPHEIEGVGIGYTPPLWEPALVDEIVPVRTDDAKDMARRIAREEALFAGTSSGANIVAALQVAERPGPGARVVTLAVDSGLKYLSTDVFSSR